MTDDARSKWLAFVESNTPSDVAWLLQQQAAELVRLREVCRDSARELAMVTINMTPGGRALTRTIGVIADLELVGKEATDGQ